MACTYQPMNGVTPSEWCLYQLKRLYSEVVRLDNFHDFEIKTEEARQSLHKLQERFISIVSFDSELHRDAMLLEVSTLLSQDQLIGLVQFIVFIQLMQLESNVQEASFWPTILSELLLHKKSVLTLGTDVEVSNVIVNENSIKALLSISNRIFDASLAIINKVDTLSSPAILEESISSAATIFNFCKLSLAVIKNVKNRFTIVLQYILHTWLTISELLCSLTESKLKNIAEKLNGLEVALRSTISTALLSDAFPQLVDHIKIQLNTRKTEMEDGKSNDEILEIVVGPASSFPTLKTKTQSIKKKSKGHNDSQTYEDDHSQSDAVSVVSTLSNISTSIKYFEQVFQQYFSFLLGQPTSKQMDTEESISSIVTSLTIKQKAIKLIITNLYSIFVQNSAKLSHATDFTPLLESQSGSIPNPKKRSFQFFSVSNSDRKHVGRILQFGVILNYYSVRYMLVRWKQLQQRLTDKIDSLDDNATNVDSDTDGGEETMLTTMHFLNIKELTGFMSNHLQSNIESQQLIQVLETWLAYSRIKRSIFESISRHLHEQNIPNHDSLIKYSEFLRQCWQRSLSNCQTLQEALTLSVKTPEIVLWFYNELCVEEWQTIHFLNLIDHHLVMNQLEEFTIVFVAKSSSSYQQVNTVVSIKQQIFSHLWTLFNRLRHLHEFLRVITQVTCLESQSRNVVEEDFYQILAASNNVLEASFKTDSSSLLSTNAPLLTKIAEDLQFHLPSGQWAPLWKMLASADASNSNNRGQKQAYDINAVYLTISAAIILAAGNAMTNQAANLGSYLPFEVNHDNKTVDADNAEEPLLVIIAFHVQIWQAVLDSSAEVFRAILQSTASLLKYLTKAMVITKLSINQPHTLSLPNVSFHAENLFEIVCRRITHPLLQSYSKIVATIADKDKGIKLQMMLDVAYVALRFHYNAISVKEIFRGERDNHLWEEHFTYLKELLVSILTAIHSSYASLTGSDSTLKVDKLVTLQVILFNFPVWITIFDEKNIQNNTKSRITYLHMQLLERSLEYYFMQQAQHIQELEGKKFKKQTEVTTSQPKNQQELLLQWITDQLTNNVGLISNETFVQIKKQVIGNLVRSLYLNQDANIQSTSSFETNCDMPSLGLSSALIHRSYLLQVIVLHMNATPVSKNQFHTEEIVEMIHESAIHNDMKISLLELQDISIGIIADVFSAFAQEKSIQACEVSEDLVPNIQTRYLSLQILSSELSLLSVFSVVTSSSHKQEQYLKLLLNLFTLLQPPHYPSTQSVLPSLIPLLQLVEEKSKEILNLLSNIFQQYFQGLLENLSVFILSSSLGYQESWNILLSSEKKNGTELINERINTNQRVRLRIQPLKAFLRSIEKTILKVENSISSCEESALQTLYTQLLLLVAQLGHQILQTFLPSSAEREKIVKFFVNNILLEDLLGSQITSSISHIEGLLEEEQQGSPSLINRLLLLVSSQLQVRSVLQTSSKLRDKTPYKSSVIQYYQQIFDDPSHPISVYCLNNQDPDSAFAIFRFLLSLASIIYATSSSTIEARRSYSTRLYRLFFATKMKSFQLKIVNELAASLVELVLPLITIIPPQEQGNDNDNVDKVTRIVDSVAVNPDNFVEWEERDTILVVRSKLYLSLLEKMLLTRSSEENGSNSYYIRNLLKTLQEKLQETLLQAISALSKYSPEISTWQNLVEVSNMIKSFTVFLYDTYVKTGKQLKISSDQKYESDEFENTRVIDDINQQNDKGQGQEKSDLQFVRNTIRDLLKLWIGNLFFIESIWSNIMLKIHDVSRPGATDPCSNYDMKLALHQDRIQIFHEITKIISMYPHLQRSHIIPLFTPHILTAQSTDLMNAINYAVAHILRFGELLLLMTDGAGQSRKYIDDFQKNCRLISRIFANIANIFDMANNLQLAGHTNTAAAANRRNAGSKMNGLNALNAQIPFIVANMLHAVFDGLQSFHQICQSSIDRKQQHASTSAAEAETSADVSETQLEEILKESVSSGVLAIFQKLGAIDKERTFLFLLPAVKVYMSEIQEEFVRNYKYKGY